MSGTEAARLYEIVAQRRYLESENHPLNYYVSKIRQCIKSPGAEDVDDLLERLEKELEGEEETLLRAFKLFDNKKQNKLGKGDLKNMNRYLGFPAEEADLNQLMLMIDTDRSNTITFDEFQEYADIAPFRGMLLGLFFVTVGFSFDVQLITNHWFTVGPLLLALLLLKSGVVIALKAPSRLSLASSLQASALLAPGGEFALVLFRLAEQVGVLPHEMVKVLVTTSVLSMALTPLLVAAADVLARRLREKRGLDGVEGRDEFAAVSVKRLTKADRGFVVICGYNVVGRTICRLLDTENEAQYIVFEDDVKTAREARTAGLPVFLADSAKRKVLEQFKVGQARCVVVAMESRNRTEQVATAMRTTYPEMPMIVRAHDEEHVKWLEETLNVKAIIPEMIAVRFGTAVFSRLGYPQDEARAVIQEQITMEIAQMGNEVEEATSKSSGTSSKSDGNGTATETS